MDIVERLRTGERYRDAWNICDEASDEIERLRLALQDIANFPLHGDYSNAYEMPTIAARALAGKIEEAE